MTSETTAILDAIRALDDAALRVVIARALGWTMHSSDVTFQDSRGSEVCKRYQVHDPNGEFVGWQGRSGPQTNEAKAWANAIPNWPADLNAAWKLLFRQPRMGWYVGANEEGDPVCHLIVFNRDRTDAWHYNEYHATPARAICHAWTAYHLRTGGDVAQRLIAAVEGGSDDE